MLNMKYIVELSREEMIGVLDALQNHVDYLERSASLQDKESLSHRLMQQSRKQLTLFRKILDNCKIIE